jgi:hypothetical protein
MDRNKIYQRIMLLKLIEGSGLNTPYEMDLDLVGNAFLGKEYKIFSDDIDNLGRVVIVGTVNLTPTAIPKSFSSRLKTFIFFFRKENDLHLVSIKTRYINAITYDFMKHIGAKKVYYTTDESETKLLSSDFNGIENIYYHPALSIHRDNISYKNVMDQFSLKCCALISFL